MAAREFQTIDELMAMLVQIAKESVTFKKIAIYIEKNYLKVIFLTASELAEQMGVSQGSVSRFFMTLGYSGYNGFLHNLQQVISQQLTAPQRLIYSQKNGTADLQNAVIAREIENITLVDNLVTTAEYQAMVKMLCQPQPLVLLSARMSATMLPYLEYVLHKMRADVSVAVPGTQTWDLLGVANNKPNVLVLAFPRYANDLIRKCAQLAKAGVDLYMVTDSRLSPVVEFAKEVLFVPVTTASLFDVYSTPMLLFNLLLRDVANNMPQLPVRMEAIEAQEQLDNVYFSK